MDKLLKDYSNVFEDLGRLPGKLHLEIDKTIEPVQHTPRSAACTKRRNQAENPINGESQYPLKGGHSHRLDIVYGGSKEARKTVHLHMSKGPQ